MRGKQFKVAPKVRNPLLRCARMCYDLNGIFAFAFYTLPSKLIICNFKHKEVGFVKAGFSIFANLCLLSLQKHWSYRFS